MTNSAIKTALSIRHANETRHALPIFIALLILPFTALQAEDAPSKQNAGNAIMLDRDRRNVSIKLSYDEGKTWAANRTLEPGFSGYSDLAVLPDGAVLCFYERGGTDGKSIYRTSLLTVARVTEDWVTAGDEADKSGKLPGIVMDGDEARLVGNWAESSNLPAIIGPTYLHDGNKDRGEKSATFTATIPKAGDYEVRLLYTWSENRSTRTKVTVTGADEEKTVRINQREPAMKDRVPNALGIFLFRQAEPKDLTAFDSVGEIRVDDSARPGAEAFHLEAADLDGDGQSELIGSTYFGSLAFYERYSLAADRKAVKRRSTGRLPSGSRSSGRRKPRPAAA